MHRKQEIMGISERKEREKQELKELILLKAKEIMARDGQDGLSIRKIANEIEYSPATIYLYFQDKDEILYQMMNKGFSLMSASMDESFAIEDPLKRLYEIGRCYVEFGVQNWDWYDLMFNSSSPMNHIERCSVEWGPGITLFEYLVKTCEDTIVYTGRKELESRALALQLWSTVHGLVNLSSTQRLCVVIPEAHESDIQNQLVDQTLKNIFLSIFNTKF